MNWQERAEKAEDVLRSLASFVGAGGYNADKVDASVFEQKIRWGIGQIMERLEKAEAELAKMRAANAAPNEIGLGKGEFVIWPVKINGVHGLAFVKTDDPKAVGTSHAEPEDGQIELGAGDSAIYFGNAESAMVLAERLQYVISLMTGSDAAPVPAVAVPEEWLKCWLIERPASSEWPAIWLTLTTDGRRWASDGGTMYATGGDWCFTSAASEALKFADKESADEYVRHNKIKDVVVTEHIFDNRALLQSANHSVGVTEKDAAADRLLEGGK